jgi:arylsulfatase A-like enzyme
MEDGKNGATRKPNILFITSDQQRGDCFGFEGRMVKTPHLDQMAREGTRFSACITPNVVCQPARASILTGLLPKTHGVSDNGIDLSAETGGNGMAGALARAGYATGFIGKAHFSSYFTFKPTGTPECFESSAQYAPDWTGPYMGFERVEMMLLGHNRYPPRQPPQGQQYEHWYYADGYGEERNRLYNTHLPPESDTPQTFHSALPVAWHNSTWVGNRTIDFIRDNHEKPFCVWASFPDPHHPFDAPEPWGRLHDPEEVELPQNRIRDFDRRPWWHRASLENEPQLPAHLKKLREEFSRIPQLSDAQLRQLIANYYGMISLIDHNVGRILTALRDCGQAENTLVVYSSDHGDWLGDHGLVLKGPMMYDGLLRVGLIARGPGVPAGKVSPEPVSTLDLLPTFLDYAGASALNRFHGSSLRALIEGNATRDFAFNEWDMREGRCGVPLDLNTVRTHTLRMTMEKNTGTGELYDLANDPHEMVNLFDDAGYRRQRQELEAMIASRPNDAPPQMAPVGTA